MGLRCFIVAWDSSSHLHIFVWFLLNQKAAGYSGMGRQHPVDGAGLACWSLMFLIVDAGWESWVFDLLYPHIERKPLKKDYLLLLPDDFAYTKGSDAALSAGPIHPDVEGAHTHVKNVLSSLLMSAWECRNLAVLVDWVPVATSVVLYV